MKQKMRWYEYITINIYWFALMARAQILTPLIVPLLVQQFVGEAAKGAYLGTMRLWALMVALLVQALTGMLSDRSLHRWACRRPFIAAGTLGHIVVLVLIGFAANLEGLTGYWVLFVLYILTMVASDSAHAATQGLIPDLVPQERRGLASGIKVLLELPLPLLFVSLVIAQLVTAGNLWSVLIVLIFVLFVCMLLTMSVREEPLATVPFDLDWLPFLRLALMTISFTVIILVVGATIKATMQATHDLAPAAVHLLVGGVGVLGMSVAIVLGVWVSIRISVGPEIQKYPSYIWWVVSRLAFLVPATNLAGFFLFFLQERFTDLQQEKAAEPAATAIMFVGILILLTAIPAGWFADRIGKKPLLVASTLLAALGTFVVLSAPHLTMVYVGSSLIGGAAGLFYSANWALGTDLVPKEQAGRYLGLSNLAGAGAGAVGAYLGGPIADSLGYGLLFTIYGFLFLLAGLPLIGVKEARKQKVQR